MAAGDEAYDGLGFRGEAWVPLRPRPEERRRRISKDVLGGAEPATPTGAFFEAPLTRGASE
jgi:hypothetical protein